MTQAELQALRRTIATKSQQSAEAAYVATNPDEYHLRKGEFAAYEECAELLDAIIEANET